MESFPAKEILFGFSCWVCHSCGLLPRFPNSVVASSFCGIPKLDLAKWKAQEMWKADSYRKKRLVLLFPLPHLPTIFLSLSLHFSSTARVPSGLVLLDDLLVLYPSPHLAAAGTT